MYMQATLHQTITVNVDTLIPQLEHVGHVQCKQFAPDFDFHNFASFSYKTIAFEVKQIAAGRLRAAP